MIWNDHSKLKKDAHAFLGASKWHWINYDRKKLVDSFNSFLAVGRGIEMHELAEKCINLGQKLPSRPNKTLSLYVNDAIGFKMTTEQILYYSENCFGTADAICFRDNMLRIHDLKTGSVPAHMEQLEIYAALFCLEYHTKPENINMELRIYQNNEVLCHTPEKDDIRFLMDKIIDFDKILIKLRAGDDNIEI